MSVWVLVGLVGSGLFTNVIMVILKAQFPGWDKKAWAPPLIGAVTVLLATLASGQITSWEALGTWLLVGIGSGATASSWRDVVKGK